MHSDENRGMLNYHHINGWWCQLQFAEPVSIRCVRYGSDDICNLSFNAAKILVYSFTLIRSVILRIYLPPLPETYSEAQHNLLDILTRIDYCNSILTELLKLRLYMSAPNNLHLCYPSHLANQPKHGLPLKKAFNFCSFCFNDLQCSSVPKTYQRALCYSSSQLSCSSRHSACGYHQVSRSCTSRNELIRLSHKSTLYRSVR